MRSRDQIADAIGIPVVASIRSRASRSVAGWTSLLQKYAPGTVETWTLRQLVRPFVRYLEDAATRAGDDLIAVLLPE